MALVARTKACLAIREGRLAELSALPGAEPTRSSRKADVERAPGRRGAGLIEIGERGGRDRQHA